MGSIPQIRTEAIEAVGRKILMEYDPSLLSGQPCPVPIETIIETKFDLILEFHTLRKNPKILGETIFDDGAVVLYDQIQRQYRMIAVVCLRLAVAPGIVPGRNRCGAKVRLFRRKQIVRRRPGP